MVPGVLPRAKRAPCAGETYWTVAALAPVLAAAAVTSAPAPAPGEAVLRAGGRTLALPARIEVRAAAGDGLPEVTREAPLAWQPWGAGLRARAAGDGWRAVATLSPAEGVRASLNVEIRWERAAVVRREAVTLQLDGPAHAVGRDLAWSPLGKPLRVDRGTPALLAAAGVLLDGNGFVAARFSRTGAYVEAQLLLDDTGAHPFRALEKCLRGVSYGADPEARRAYAALEQHPLPTDRTRREAGDVSRGHADLWLTDPAAPPVPLIVERWPGGARAAVVFTDHADRTDPPALRAVLYGTSDRSEARYGRGGFSGNGIRLTKSFFARGGRGSLLDDPEAAALADELAAMGSDVVPHSISPHRDERPAVSDGLGRFRRWGSNTWIDHQPYTNCEAMASLGWRDDGEFGLRDLLVAHGYRWVWDMNDASGQAALSNVFTATPAGEPGTPVYPLPMDPRLWMFRSTWFYAPPGELAAAMSELALDELERERGLFIGHTYLSATRRTTRAEDLAARIAVRPLKNGAYELDPRLDEALGRLGRRVRSGTIASMTLREAGERLVALEDVEVTYLPDGRVAIENCGGTALPGLTVAVPAALDLTVDGVDAAGLRPGRDRTTVWFDLPAARRAVVSASRHGRPVPFLRARNPTLVAAP